MLQRSVLCDLIDCDWYAAICGLTNSNGLVPWIPPGNPHAVDLGELFSGIKNPEKLSREKLRAVALTIPNTQLETAEVIRYCSSVLQEEFDVFLGVGLLHFRNKSFFNKVADVLTTSSYSCFEEVVLVLCHLKDEKYARYLLGEIDRLVYGADLRVYADLGMWEFLFRWAKGAEWGLSGFVWVLNVINCGNVKKLDTLFHYQISPSTVLELILLVKESNLVRRSEKAIGKFTGLLKESLASAPKPWCKNDLIWIVEHLEGVLGHSIRCPENLITYVKLFGIRKPECCIVESDVVFKHRIRELASPEVLTELGWANHFMVDELPFNIESAKLSSDDAEFVSFVRDYDQAYFLPNDELSRYSVLYDVDPSILGKLKRKRGFFRPFNHLNLKCWSGSACYLRLAIAYCCLDDFDFKAREDDFSVWSIDGVQESIYDGVFDGVNLPSPCDETDFYSKVCKLYRVSRIPFFMLSKLTLVDLYEHRSVFEYLFDAICDVYRNHNHCDVLLYRIIDQWILTGDPISVLCSIHRPKYYAECDDRVEAIWLSSIHKKPEDLSSFSRMELDHGWIGDQECWLISDGIIVEKHVDCELPQYVVSDDGEEHSVFVGASLEGDKLVPWLSDRQWGDSYHKVKLKRI